MSDLKNSQRGDAATATVLRVLAGANAGAELVLRDGAWLVGSGEDADITFAEPALAPAHVRLLLERDRVGIEVLADGVRVGSEPAPPGLARGLQALETVSIGATVFVTGRAGSVWPDPAVSLRNTSIAAQDVGAAADAAPQPADPPPPPSDPPPAEIPAVSAPAPLSISSRERWFLPLAGVVLLLLAAGTGCWWWLSRPAPQTPAQTAPAIDQAAVARQVIGGLGLSDRLAVARNNDQTTVTGQMKDDQGVRALVRTLHDAGFTGEVSVMTDAAVVDAIHTIMASLGVTTDISMAGPGAVVMTGFADDADRVATALQRVRSDVPGIKTIDDRIQTPDRARAALVDAIRSAGLASVLAVTAPADADGLTVKGSLAPEAMEKWKPIAAAFQQTNGDRIKLIQQITPALSVTPRGVELGRQPHLVMDDGRRLGIGDMLDSVGRIVAISDRNVRVTTPSGQINVPFTHPPVWITEDANAR